MGFISSMGREPLINGDPKVVQINAHFSKFEPFQTTILGHQSSLMVGFYFMHGRGTPLKTGTLKLCSLMLTIQKMKLFTLVYLAITHRERMDFISSRGGGPLINGDPKVVYINGHFSESEALQTGIVSLQSSLKDGFHFIHGRGAPL